MVFEYEDTVCEEPESSDHSNIAAAKPQRNKPSQKRKEHKKRYSNDENSSEGSNSTNEAIYDCSLKLTKNPINKASIFNYKILKTIGKGLYSKVKLAASNS